MVPQHVCGTFSQCKTNNYDFDFWHCKCVHEAFLQVIKICTAEKKPSNVIVNLFMATWIYMGWFVLKIEGPTSILFSKY